jgi:hypothetical protein
VGVAHGLVVGTGGVSVEVDVEVVLEVDVARLGGAAGPGVEGPLAAGLDEGHPSPSLPQHHFFFSSDHPSSQWAYPSQQSKGKDVVDAAHPFLACAQHQVFFLEDHP